MFGVFLKLLIFRVMIARAIKHWLRALHVLVKKISIICVGVRARMNVCGHVCAYASDRFSTLMLDF